MELKEDLIEVHSSTTAWFVIKTINWIKLSIFNKWCKKAWILTCRRKNLDSYHRSHLIIQDSKWIKDLGESPGALKLLEHSAHFIPFAHVRIFWSELWQYRQYDQQSKKSIAWNKSFCLTRKLVSQWNERPQNAENLCQIPSDSKINS